jgi:hypothetical protein
MEDKRNNPRHRVMKPGTIGFNGSDIECTYSGRLLDSHTGAMDCPIDRPFPQAMGAIVSCQEPLPSDVACGSGSEDRRLPQDVRSTLDCVAKLGRSRLQSLVVSFNRPLVCALPCVGFGVHSWAPMLGKSLPEVVGHGREAWRAASGSARWL